MARSLTGTGLEVWRLGASFAGGASATSGSWPCGGMSTLVGNLYSSSSGVAASGIRVLQSFDGGTNWDLQSVGPIVGGAASGLSYTIYGDAVMVELRNGATTAASVRSLWWLK